MFPLYFDELSEDIKIFFIKRAQTCHLLCRRPGCCHSTSKTQVRERIFKLILIYASVNDQIL